MDKKVIISLPHLKQGGSERATAELANYFVSQEIETVILLMYNKPKTYELNEKVRLIEPSKIWSFLPKFIYPFFIILFLRNNIKSEKASTILTFGYKTYIFFACLGVDVRVIDSLRTSPNRIRFPKNKLLNSVYNLTRNLLNRRVDGVVAQTNSAKKELMKTHSCEIKVIPNFIREIEKNSCEKRNIIISVGRLVPIKGHKYLIKAFAKTNLKNWKLQLLGDGPLKSDLKKLVSELGISNSVIFEGYKSNVDYYMQQAKIFVLPSLAEGFPNALIEAMANGLACISFDCESGPSDIISHGKNGLLVEVKNINKLAKYINELAIDEKLRCKIGRNAQSVRDKYEKEEIGQQYIDFIFKENYR